MRNFWYRGLAIVSALVLVCLLISVSLAVLSNTRSSSTATTTATASATVTATATASPSAAVCDAKFVQVVANNNGDKVDGDFEQKYAAATSGAANLSDAQKQLLLTETANNAQRLAIWSNGFGLYASPNNWQPLVDGNCLSAAGRDLYNQFAGALNAKGTTFAEGDAPATGYNSGVSGGTYQVYATPGVTGNRKAIKVTLANGTVVWIMVRCGNVVYSTPPPGVPTTTPPVVTPSPTCPPKTHGVWPVCKDDPAVDPQNLGNNKTGGGGKAPVQTDPVGPPAAGIPPAAYTKPAAPAPAAAVPVGAIPDPVPAPAPEPAAPPPGGAARGTSCAPGIPTC
jgi:hypothetical protein